MGEKHSAITGVWLILLGIGGILVAMVVMAKCGEGGGSRDTRTVVDDGKEKPRKERKPRPAKPPKPKPEPVFVTKHASNEPGGAREMAAAKAVHARCGSRAIFEGAIYEAATAAADDLVSVSVDVRNKAAAVDGHTLWYFVKFEDDSPVAMNASKDIAADVCGLPGREVDVPL